MPTSLNKWRQKGHAIQHGMLNIPFYFLFSLLTDDDFPPKTMEFRHFAMGKVRSALKGLSRRCCFLAAHRRELV